MSTGTIVANIVHRTTVLGLAGLTLYYVVGIGTLVNRRLELKRQGRLQEELSKYAESNREDTIQAYTATTTTPLRSHDQPGIDSNDE